MKRIAIPLILLLLAAFGSACAADADGALTLERIKAALNVRGDAQTLWPLLSVLSHGSSRELTPKTLTLFDESDLTVQSRLVVALIEQHSCATETRKRIRAMLAAESAEAREMAAEYYTWLGADADVADLEGAREFEQDPYVRAALIGAIKAIEYRRARFGSTMSELLLANSTSVSVRPATLENYVAMKKSVSVAAPGRDALASALNFYWESQKIEPASAEVISDPNAVTLLEQRYQLSQELFSPCGATGRQNAYLDARKTAVADHWVPPIRDYFDPQRTSFGVYTGKNAALFTDSYHAGDDCGWTQQLQTVVAIAPGLVRMVVCTPTWGHLVVIEHTLADGTKVCSLYGHLSPLLLVKPGDLVAAGEKIGSIGRNETIENGGYTTHLHFGIHLSLFNFARKNGDEIIVNVDRAHSSKGMVIQSDSNFAIVEIPANHMKYKLLNTAWVTGYLSPGDWDDGRHGWQDPQKFLHEKGGE